MLSNHSFMDTCGLFCDNDEDVFRLSTDSHNKTFKGINVNTGANHVSTMSLKKYMAYCQKFGVTANVNV